MEKKEKEYQTICVNLFSENCGLILLFLSSFNNLSFYAQTDDPTDNLSFQVVPLGQHGVTIANAVTVTNVTVTIANVNTVTVTVSTFTTVTVTVLARNKWFHRAGTGVSCRDLERTRRYSS